MTRLLIAIALTLLCVASVWAVDVNISGSNNLELRKEVIETVSYPGQINITDTNMFTIVDHGLVDLRIGENFSLGTEIDTRQPRRSKYSTAEEYTASILDQFHATYADDVTRVTLGHYSVTLGKGLSLRAYREDELEYDHTLTGAYARVSPISQLEMAILSGTNTWADPTTIEKDNVQGAELIIRPIQQVMLGGSFGRVRSLDQLTNYHTYNQIPSVFLGANIWKFAIYGEVSMPENSYIQTTYEGEPGGPQKMGQMRVTDKSGHGQYGSLQFSHPGIGVSLQYKDYLKQDGKYTNPPPCTHTGTSLNSGADEKGYMGELTVSPMMVIQITGGYATAENSDELLPADLNQYWAGTQFTGIENMVLNADFVHDKLFLQVLETNWNKDISDTPSISADIVVADDHTISVGAAYEMHNNSMQMELPEGLMVYTAKYYYARPSIGYAYKSRVYLTLDYETSDHTEEIATGTPIEDTSWMFGKVRYVITDQHSLTVGYGSRRGGKVCSGGMCMQESPFEGLLVGLVSYF